MLKSLGKIKNSLVRNMTAPATVFSAVTLTAATDERIEVAEILFAASGKTLTWHEGDSTILEFAEANNLDPAYSCRAGICGICMCKIREGKVNYQETPTAEIDQGSVLICISQPKTSRVVLDL